MPVLVLLQKSLNKVPLHKYLENHKVILITTFKNKKIIDKQHLEKKFIHIEYLNDYSNTLYIEYLAKKMFDKFKYAKIISISEIDVIRCANIREKLKLSGQSISSAYAYRDKYIMKSYLSNKVDIAPYDCYEGVYDILDYIEDYGFPIVIKPRLGSSSVDIQIINDNVQLEIYLKENKQNEFNSEYKLMMIESFIHGDMYTVDGLMNDGEVLFSTTSKYINHILDSLIKNKYSGCITLNRDSKENMILIEYVSKIIKNLPKTIGILPFHAEIFLDANQTPLLCEIASRTGGAGLCRMIELKYGINLDEISIKSQAEALNDFYLNNCKDNSFTYGILLIPPKNALLLEYPEKCNIDDVVYYEPLATKGNNYRNSCNSVDRIVSFIIKGKSELELNDKMAELYDWYNSNFIWSDPYITDTLSKSYTEERTSNKAV